MTTQQAADRSGLPELDVTTEDLQLAARLDSTFASHLAILKCRERQLLAALKRIQELESKIGMLEAGICQISYHIMGMHPEACCGCNECVKAMSPESIAELMVMKGDSK